MSSPQHGSWPSDVGIMAMEIYFPYQYVDQTELETYDNVSAGKYTVGLGQRKMGFCSDREDINSLCLTVVHNLMDHYSVPYDRIGRIEVGTETILDKSKSVKSVLMQLFQASGNTDVEGVDTTNACYGGTAALFNSLAWLESSAWDGRLALVVAGDIAVYASGNARPTGGAGAVAFLLGPNAPIVFDRGIRASHSIHVYDFYKPDLESEYPRVDGKLSIQCYLSALDKCYQGFGRKSQLNNNEMISLSSFEAFIFHSPYCKLVQKSLARLLLNDVISHESEAIVKQFPALDALRSVKLEDTYFDRDIEKVLLESSKTIFEEKTIPSLVIASEVGNMYTPSVYGGLVSHIINTDIDKLLGSRLCMFSYGSGLQASMYSLRITNDRSKFMKATLSLAGAASRLQNRLKISPEEFSKTMLLRENNHHTAPYVPVGSTCDLFEGTYYLESVDEMHRRKYSRVKYVNGTK